jgi:hypothetical protein
VGSAERPGARPVGSAGARGALLLVLALVLGVVLLQKFDTGTVAFTERVDTNATTATTRQAPTVSVVPSAPVRQPRAPSEIKVLPANGTSTTGLGGKTGDFLRTAGYNALAAMDATRNLDASLVLYKPDFEPEARTLAQLLQLPASAVKVLDDNAPVADTRGADIVVVAGADLHLPDTTSTTRR